MKKDESKRTTPNSQDKHMNNMVSNRPNRNMQIFLGHCYSCNKFGHKALNCRANEKVPEYEKKSSNKPK